MTMGNSRPKYPRFSWALVGCSLLAIAFLPLLAVMSGEAVGVPVKPLLWALCIIVAFFYVRHRCSSPQLFFEEGLCVIAYSLRAWTVGLCYILVAPTIFLVLIASTVAALWNDARQKPELSPVYFGKLVGVVYKNRTFR